MMTGDDDWCMAVRDKVFGGVVEL